MPSLLKICRTPIFIAAAFSIFSAAPSGADPASDLLVGSRLPHPPYPFEAMRQHMAGVIELEISFAQDGTVKSCHVIRSTAPPLLQDYTVKFILGHWKNPDLAGKTYPSIPLIFQLADESRPGFPSPPDYITAGEPGRKLTLHVAFDDDGFVHSATVAQHSGSADLDAKTAAFVRAHWYCKEDAGKSIDAPFIFPPLPAHFP